MSSPSDDMRRFERTFYQSVFSGTRGLDLGAGDGKWAAEMAETYEMVGVDRKAPKFSHDRLSWRQMRIEEWAAEPDGEPFDFVLSRNVIQFLDRPFMLGTLLPAIKRRVRPGGVVGIKTFSANPEPSLGIAFPTFFSAQEIAGAFDDWVMILCAEEPEHSLAMTGSEIRLWQTVQFIARNPATP